MALIEERIMDYIDDLQLQIDRLKLQIERKDDIIWQLTKLCDKWHGELKKYDDLYGQNEEAKKDICYTCEHMCNIQRRYKGASMLSCGRYERGYKYED
jgi:hypothetical protein